MDLTALRPWWPLGDLEQMGEAMRHWLSLQWDTSITVGEWWERLASAGLTVPTWQRAHGGLAATTPVQSIIERELGAAHTVAPPVDGTGIRVVGPALRQFATSEQVTALLPALITGRHSWAVLLHEPGEPNPQKATCRAEIGWNGITLTGTKAMTDTESSPDRALVFARSNDEGGRRGLTTVIVELAASGVSVGGGVVTFDGVRLPAEAMLGPQDQGWEVAKVVTPYFERSLAGRIRRGVVHVEPGPNSGNLERVVGDVLTSAPTTPPAAEDRRRH